MEKTDDARRVAKGVLVIYSGLLLCNVDVKLVVDTRAGWAHDRDAYGRVINA